MVTAEPDNKNPPRKSMTSVIQFTLGDAST